MEEKEDRDEREAREEREEREEREDLKMGTEPANMHERVCFESAPVLRNDYSTNDI